MNMWHRFISTVAAWSVCFATAWAASAESQLTGLAVYPPEVHLSGPEDLQRLIVVATRGDGVTLDVTAAVAATVHDAGIAACDTAVVRPVADGATMLEVTYSGLQASVPVEVRGAATPREMGKVMGWLKPKVAGRADGKTLSDMVRARLGG